MLRLAIGMVATAATAMPSPAAGEGHAPLPGFECDPLAQPPGFATARLSEEAALAGIEEPNVERAYRRALRRGGPELRAARARATEPVRVPVYVHVIQENAVEGAVDPAEIDAQIAVLNQSFGGATGGENVGFVFELAGTDVTVNPDWYPLEYRGANERQAKSALREGDSRALNIYLAALESGLLGWATFPDQYAGDPGMDGVVVENETVPGGTNVPYHLGDTATHEVGHWLGLFHTFEGTIPCDPQNDLVADTPAELTEHDGCPAAGEDSCPHLPGPDPIRNFMEYVDDACMDEFTPGQADRVHDQTSRYRNGMPQLAALPARVKAGRSVALELSGTDPDADALVYAVVDGPDHGRIEGTGASLTYTPKKRYAGRDSATIRATDVFDAAGIAEVPITVVGDRRIRLKAKAKAKQRLRRLTVKAGCRGEGCDLTARAKIKAKPPKDEGGKARKLSTKKAEGSAKPNRKRKLKLKLAKAKAKRLAGLLADGWRAKAEVKVSATDAAGNRARDRSSIKLK